MVNYLVCYVMFQDLDSEMGTKVKKAMKNLKRATTNKPSEDADFLVCER